MTVAEFRKRVKTTYPHVKVSVRTVSFVDLARCSRLCLSVDGEREGELAQINAWAREAGIIADTSVRFYE